MTLRRLTHGQSFPALPPQGGYIWPRWVLLQLQEMPSFALPLLGPLLILVPAVEAGGSSQYLVPLLPGSGSQRRRIQLGSLQCQVQESQQQKLVLRSPLPVSGQGLRMGGDCRRIGRAMLLWRRTCWSAVRRALQRGGGCLHPPWEMEWVLSTEAKGKVSTVWALLPP